jgi:hypothetical protein
MPRIAARWLAGAFENRLGEEQGTRGLRAGFHHLVVEALRVDDAAVRDREDHRRPFGGAGSNLTPASSSAARPATTAKREIALDLEAADVRRRRRALPPERDRPDTCDHSRNW